MIFKFLLSFNSLWFLFINLQSNVILSFIFARYNSIRKKKDVCWKTNRVWHIRLRKNELKLPFFFLSLFPPALQVYLFDSNCLFNYTSLFILITVSFGALNQIILKYIYNLWFCAWRRCNRPCVSLSVWNDRPKWKK